MASKRLGAGKPDCLMCRDTGQILDVTDGKATRVACHRCIRGVKAKHAEVKEEEKAKEGKKVTPSEMAGNITNFLDMGLSFIESLAGDDEEEEDSE